MFAINFLRLLIREHVVSSTVPANQLSRYLVYLVSQHQITARHGCCCLGNYIISFSWQFIASAAMIQLSTHSFGALQASLLILKPITDCVLRHWSTTFPTTDDCWSQELTPFPASPLFSCHTRYCSAYYYFCVDQYFGVFPTSLRLPCIMLGFEDQVFDFILVFGQVELFVICFPPSNFNIFQTLLHKLLAFPTINFYCIYTLLWIIYNPHFTVKIQLHYSILQFTKL